MNYDAKVVLLLSLLFVIFFGLAIFFLVHPPYCRDVQIGDQTVSVNLRTKEVQIYERIIIPVWLVEKNGNFFRTTKSIPDYHCPLPTTCTVTKPATQQEIAIYKAAIKAVTNQK